MDGKAQNTILQGNSNFRTHPSKKMLEAVGEQTLHCSGLTQHEVGTFSPFFNFFAALQSSQPSAPQQWKVDCILSHKNLFTECSSSGSQQPKIELQNYSSKLCKCCNLTEKSCIFLTYRFYCPIHLRLKLLHLGNGNTYKRCLRHQRPRK